MNPKGGWSPFAINKNKMVIIVIEKTFLFFDLNTKGINTRNNIRSDETIQIKNKLISFCNTSAKKPYVEPNNNNVLVIGGLNDSTHVLDWMLIIFSIVLKSLINGIIQLRCNIDAKSIEMRIYQNFILIFLVLF